MWFNGVDDAGLPTLVQPPGRFLSGYRAVLEVASVIDARQPGHMSTTDSMAELQCAREHLAVLGADCEVGVVSR